MTNLISNACKLSAPGTEVVVMAEDRGDKIRLSVRDHGPGIAPEFKHRIFEKFAQADNSFTKHKAGTGLGLSIAREIIQRLGGEIDFANAPGGGTIFFVSLLASVHGNGVGVSSLAATDTRVGGISKPEAA